MVGAFIELHVEQGRGLVDLDRPIAVGSSILAHGRWRLDLAGEANHAGTTRLEDRRDPMIDLAAAVTAARSAARARGCVATVGKVAVIPNGVNAIPSAVTAWLDARGDAARAVAADVGHAAGTAPVEESYTPDTRFDPTLVTRLARLLGDAPVLGTGAGHDAGILAAAGVPAAMLFVRNPTGVSHSPAEHAEPGRLPGRRGRARRRHRGPGRMTSYWAEHAWLPDGVAAGVTLEVADGRFTRVEPGRSPGDSTRLAGVVLPGFADVHGHAFHRALRGRTHADGGTFWSWREAMYAVAARLDPDSYLELARTTYAELARAGVSTVGEFHYLHHGPGGVPYQDPNAMAEALAAGGHRCRRPADPAGHLLPRGRTDRGRLPAAGGSAAALRRPGRGRVGGPGRRPQPVRRHAGRRRGALGARGAGHGTVHSGWCGRAAARPPVRAARRERGVPRLPRPHARPRCSPSTVCSRRERPPCTAPI